MSARFAKIALVVTIVVVLVELVLVRAMAHGHVAHVLLGAGNAVPPLASLLLAATLVVVRVVAITIGPGVALAALVSLAAEVRGRSVSRRERAR